MGHFANLGYSGFDPIFMLHHAAIDRHVALWQAVYHNDSMFNSSYVSPVGQFATAPGTRITADSPLKPFYADANGTFHTSNSVRDVATLGYTYPELALAGNWTSREALSRHVRTVVNQLYGNTTKLTMSRRGVELEPKTRLEYYVEVEVEKEGLKLPATLMVWVGDRLAGRVVLLGGPARGIAHGEVTLPDELVNNFVPDTDGGVIPKGLKDNLFWTIADVGRPPLFRLSNRSISLANIRHSLPVGCSILGTMQRWSLLWSRSLCCDASRISLDMGRLRCCGTFLLENREMCVRRTRSAAGTRENETRFSAPETDCDLYLSGKI